MSSIPQTYTFGRGNTVAGGTVTGIPGQGDVFTNNPIDPFFLGDFPGSTAALQAGCDCEIITPTYTNLSTAAHPYHNLMFLFRSKPEAQLAPIQIQGTVCRVAPIGGLQDTVRFHIVEDGVFDFHAQRSNADPTATLDRVDLRNMDDAALATLKIKGYEQILGDQPGYKDGLEVSFEGGKIKNKMVSKNIIKRKLLTATNEGDHLKIDGVSNLFIRDLVFYYDDNITQQERFHLVFKYDFDLSDACGPANYRIRQVLAQETIIDNIVIVPSNKNTGETAPSSTSPADVLGGELGAGKFIAVDTRFTTADYIEVWGYLPNITQVEVYYLEPSDYHDNVLKSSNFGSAFDSHGRLFLFYQEDINFTELPYENITCGAPGSSSTLVFPSSSTTGTGGGSGDFGGTGTGGGGGGGGAGGGGGIPGNNPTPVTTSGSSSSSSASPVVVFPPGTSSSSTSVDKIPPSPPSNSAVNEQTNTDGTAPVVILSWDAPPDKDVDHYNIYWSLDPDTGFVLIGSTQDTTFTHVGASVNRWNYYRITAVDTSGNESNYDLLQIFVIPPRPCQTRDCLNCKETSGFVAKTTYEVFFSEFSPANLAFKCASCSGSDGFVRFLSEGFYTGTSTLTTGGQTATSDPALVGAPVPKFFCLLEDCVNDDPTKGCTWTNTFYMPALVSKCTNIGCDENFEKILLPLTVTLSQTPSGWGLEAYGIGPDCARLDIFKATNTLTPCFLPSRFINELPSSGVPGELTTNICGIYPPTAYKKHTGTISAAMSPDLGRTWFKYQGVINITNDRKAINPFVTHDDKNDLFHLFWVERDYINDDSILLQAGLASGVTGFTAYLKHKSIPAAYFEEGDAFINFLPSPSSSSSSTVDPFTTTQLGQLSRNQRLIRSRPENIIVTENASGKTNISLTTEFNTAYVDQQSRVSIIRFGQSGTLVDPPDRLTRVRLRTVDCGDFTWTVSGTTDTDCACQSLMGVFNMQFDSLTSEWDGGSWALRVSADFNYWEVSSDNNIFIFHKKRTISLCPPTGAYEILCSRCLGTVIGTLERVSVEIYADNAPVDNGSFNPSGSNKTNFGSIPSGSFVQQDYVIRNNTPNTLHLTGNPLVSVVGADAGEFVVISPPRAVIGPYDSSTFTLKFTPSGDCSATSAASIKTAQVRITNDLTAGNLYQFNVQGRCTPRPTDAPSSNGPVNQNSGIVYSADAIGKVLTSVDGGDNWTEQILEIKAGQYGNAAYDEKAGALYVAYVTNDMLFGRRYPSWTYGKRADELSDLDPAFDGLNIVDPSQTILPNTDVFQNGIPSSAIDFVGSPTFFDLPNITVPADVLSTTQPDLQSIRIPLTNEKDPRGLPVFLAGNRYGEFFNAVDPYPSSFIFDQNQAVGPAQPALYVTKSGAVRFFYVDFQGNVNAGTLSGNQASIDAKLRP